MILLRIGTGNNQLCRSMSVNREVHLILNCRVEALGCQGSSVVIQSCCIKIGDLLIEFTLADTNLPNSFQLLVKVFISQESTALEAFLIHYPPLNGVGGGNLIDPFAELNGTFGINLESDRYNHLKIIVVCRIVFSIGGSYSKFSNN